MKLVIPCDEQAEAILHAKTWQLAQKYCDGNHEVLLTLLTAGREDLKNYIAEHGFPMGWWRFEPATYDGLYSVEEAGKWVIYLQERGGIYYRCPHEFCTKADAVDFVLDHFYLKSR